MKKAFYYILMACNLVMANACSTEEQADNTDNTKNSEQTTGRKLRTLTINQKTQSAAGNTTRSILIDKGEEGIYASWEMGDEVTAYNADDISYAVVKATSTTKYSTFTGTVNCQTGDELRLFYPQIGSGQSVTNSNGKLTLDISKQKGTLDDIQLHYDFNYGVATVTDVTDETATADAGSTENLATICKFTFKCDNEYVKNISRVDIANVTPTATFSLAGRAQLTSGEIGEITVSGEKIEKSVYVTLFPGETAPSFTVMASKGKYEGSLSASILQAGKSYDVVVETTRTGEGTGGDTGDDNGGNEGNNDNFSEDYVEVCGVKWARGNLQYDPVDGGDEGFVENWRVASTQWDYATSYNDEKKDNFGWGVINAEAYDYSSNRNMSGGGWDLTFSKNRIVCFFPETNVDIKATLYSYFVSGAKNIAYGSSSGSSYTKTTSHDEAIKGDLAYYASYGKYRLPSKEELLKLSDEASIQYGFVITPSGTVCYGILFTNPDGERSVSYEERQIDLSELNHGLFLPMANYLIKVLSYGAGTSYLPKSSLELSAGGSYWSSLFSEFGNSSVDVYAIRLSNSSVSVMDYTSYSQYINGNINYYVYSYRKIRPVLCEEH